jgi:ATP-dependent helicase HrpB
MSFEKIKLPVDDYLNEIIKNLENQNNLVITAEPGAGKTTRVPPALLQLCSKSIVMLEPRRIAAVASAQRIAEENDWTLGQEVGYQVRFENKTIAETKIKIVTEALLNRWISQDFGKERPLENIDIVILDEFHERSIHADLAIGLLKEIQMLERPDLKIVVMSATIDAEKVSEFLDHCPIMKIPGQVYPVEVTYIKESQILKLQKNSLGDLAERIRSAYEKAQSTGTALVFLPGTYEIQIVYENLKFWADPLKIELQILHGSLKLEEQRKVLNSNPPKRIVLTTNVAETSLTLQGVDTVIDSGLAKISEMDPKTGFMKLSTKRISRASAKQREGRAGRIKNGKSFKLWNKMDELSMPPFEKPEIMRTDLCETLLTLSGVQQKDFFNFSWFEKPLSQQIEKALFQLKFLKIIDDQQCLTELGKKISLIPAHPRIAKMILQGWNFEKEFHKPLFELSCEIASLIQERDIFSASGNDFHENDTQQSDLILKWLQLHQSHKNGRLPAQWKNLFFNSKNQFMNLIDKSLNKKNLNSMELSREFGSDIGAFIKKIIFLAYSDRLCKKRKTDGDTALMVGGRGVKISKESSAFKSLFFVALDGIENSNSSDTLCSLASGIEEDWIYEFFKDQIIKKEEFYFDKDKGKFFIKEVQMLQDLPLSEGGIKICPPEVAQNHFPEILIKEKSLLLSKNAELTHWVSRFNYLQKNNELDFVKYGNFFDSLFLEVLDEVLFGEHEFEKILEKDWVYFLENKLSKTELEKLNQLAPAKLQVPSGSSILIQYPEDKSPYLEVRLQEVFGWNQTPHIGKTPLVIHLLGPNYRPVQVTQDLASFWKNTYNEVRKELRLKYPKHSWPEDPLTAIAVAKGRPQK